MAVESNPNGGAGVIESVFKMSIWYREFLTNPSKSYHGDQHPSVCAVQYALQHGNVLLPLQVRRQGRSQLVLRAMHCEKYFSLNTGISLMIRGLHHERHGTSET